MNAIKTLRKTLTVYQAAIDKKTLRFQGMISATAYQDVQAQCVCKNGKWDYIKLPYFKAMHGTVLHKLETQIYVARNKYKPIGAKLYESRTEIIM